MKIVKTIIIAIALLFLCTLSMIYLAEFTEYIDKNNFSNLITSLYITTIIIWLLATIALAIGFILVLTSLTKKS